jgi:hypothetical protein
MIGYADDLDEQTFPNQRTNKAFNGTINHIK